MTTNRGPEFTTIPDVPLTDEPPLPQRRGAISTGMLVVHDDATIAVVEPKGHFGGYRHTFPKGKLAPGLTAQQNAHRELHEETGLTAHVTGYLGDYQGTTGVTRFYLATRKGGTPLPDDPTPYVAGGRETAVVTIVGPEEAAQLLNTTRDKAVLADALKHPQGRHRSASPPPTEQAEAP